MTPYRSPDEGSNHSNFNIVHAKTRNIIERTIGVLKNRFRCLLGARQLHYTPQKASKIVNVCAALHNICLHYKSDPPVFDPAEPENSSNLDIGTNENINDDQVAVTIRNNLCSSISFHR